MAAFFFNDGGRFSPLSADEAQELIGEATVALAELENQSLDAAIPRLESIAQALPDDPFGPRNLAVARIIAAGEGRVDEAVVSQAVSALERAASIEGGSPPVQWLSAKLAMLSGDLASAAVSFEKIVAESPHDAAAWYGLWKALSEQAAAGQADTRPFDALTTACEADPSNVWLSVEWFRAAAGVADQGLLPAAELSLQIEERWPTVAPFAAAVLAFTKTDIRDLLDKAKASVETADTLGAGVHLRGLANVLVSQAASDRAAVDPHPLEFVIEQLSQDVTDASSATTENTPAIPVHFAEAGVVEDGSSPLSAVVLEDIDLDGRTDAVLLTKDRVSVVTFDGDQWLPAVSTAVPSGSSGLIAVDLDLDFDEAKRIAEVANSGTDPTAEKSALRHCPAADLDLIVYGSAGIVCLENRLEQDSGRRELRPYETAMPSSEGAVRAVAAADLEADGLIDMVTADEKGLRIWRNQGSQGFVEATPANGLPPADLPVSSMLAVDFDRDMDVDIILAGDQGVGLLENLRHGQFRFRPLALSFAVHGLDLIDFDANGSWDLVAAGPGGVSVHTHESLLEAGGIEAGARSRGSESLSVDETPASGVCAVDFDNDGLLDLVSWSPEGVLKAWRRAAAGFQVFSALPDHLHGVRSCDFADLDSDGDLDLMIAADQSVVLDNVGGNANHWLAIDLEAQQIKGGDFAPSGRVNAHGLGSLIELKAGRLYQPRCVRRRTTHFGLGSFERADAVRVLWLNGVPQNIVRPEVDLVICEQQILLGSCPYLYTWNGSRFEFVTDLLWAAPLGLQRAAGDLVPDRPEEFLSIPRGNLVAKQGEYHLQITEELWEAAYFDQVKLLVVDHPPGTEVFSNEKVGPPEIAEFYLHTIANRRLPRSIQTGDGRDVLSVLAADDGQFLPPARKLRQGLTEPQVLEIDFGEMTEQPLTLFLSGWTYPTTVSQNLALSRDPALGLPEPPSLAVPDGAGGWKTAIPMMGFPGGKKKTIAIDLTEVMQWGDPRIQITTSMEIAWDAVFFSSGERPAETKITEILPLSAHLHSRGFSRIQQPDAVGPEQFLYEQVDTAPKWPPMHGCFTRFGDVRELLLARDDHLVVMASGDEMKLRFAAPPLAQEGWERDFVLACVGWDKDANLATATGHAVEPLPFFSMQTYPPGPEDSPPADPSYRTYLQRYQTRRMAKAFWTALRRPDWQR